MMPALARMLCTIPPTGRTVAFAEAEDSGKPNVGILCEISSRICTKTNRFGDRPLNADPGRPCRSRGFKKCVEITLEGVFCGTLAPGTRPVDPGSPAESDKGMPAGTCFPEWVVKEVKGQCVHLQRAGKTGNRIGSP